ncbi:MAG: hypothetical protein ACEY26_00700 [Candidatus Hodgkinia cicadicola]
MIFLPCEVERLRTGDLRKLVNAKLAPAVEIGKRHFEQVRKR